VPSTRSAGATTDGKALKRTKSVKATLTVVATDAAGNRTTKKLKVTLKR
jgi:hypothetical protein